MNPTSARTLLTDSRWKSNLLSKVQCCLHDRSCSLSAFRDELTRPTKSPSSAVQHMTTYWSILEKMRGSNLRLTKMDDEIYRDFQKVFPEFDPAATINEDEMKSKAGKEKWRNWMMQYEKKIDDFNFGTMLRASPKVEYTEKDTIFGT